MHEILNWYFWGRSVIGWRSLSHHLIDCERYLAKINLRTSLAIGLITEIKIVQY